MKGKKGPFQPQTLLWWLAIISLTVSAALYFFLREQAQYDISLDERRLQFPLVGIIIAGICIIAGTARHWFYPK
jgi:hypothetical protein